MASDIITLTEDECRSLGVLPLDNGLNLLSAQVNLFDKNNNPSKKHDSEVITIDSDPEDFANMHDSRVKVEIGTPDNLTSQFVQHDTTLDDSTSGFVLPSDIPKANDFTLGFFNDIGSASTPNCDNAKSSSPEVRYTPPKKKTATLMFRSPTNKTPKRKISFIKLMWPGNVTDAFVKACVSRKVDIQKPDVPLRIWKDIKEEMKEVGHNETWECYRAKFLQMNDFFASSALGKCGIVHGVMWPYYNQFCLIHDVPPDFVPSEESDEVTVAALTPSKKSRLWTDAAEKKLISLYAAEKDKFDGTKSVVRHSTLYNKIAGIMSKVHKIKVSSKQCKAHMNELKSEFRKAYDESRGTGAGAPTFPHFAQMLEIFHGSASLVTPFATSVGQGLAYSVNGVSTDTTSQTGTRTRPSNDKSAKGRNPKKPVYRSWNREVAERQLELKEQENEQFRLMREGFEKKSAERETMIKDLMKLAAWDLQMRLAQNSKDAGNPPPIDLNSLKSLQN